MVKRQEIIEFAFSHFKPLNEEEQKAMMMVVLDAYLEMQEKIEEGQKTGDNIFKLEKLKQFSKIYSFMLDFFVTNEVTKTREFLLKQGYRILEKQKEQEEDA